jgi:hypothetical protein
MLVDSSSVCCDGPIKRLRCSFSEDKSPGHLKLISL